MEVDEEKEAKIREAVRSRIEAQIQDELAKIKQKVLKYFFPKSNNLTLNINLRKKQRKRKSWRRGRKNSGLNCKQPKKNVEKVSKTCWIGSITIRIMMDLALLTIPEDELERLKKEEEDRIAEEQRQEHLRYEEELEQMIKEERQRSIEIQIKMELERLQKQAWNADPVIWNTSLVNDIAGRRVEEKGGKAGSGKEGTPAEKGRNEKENR